MVLVYTVGYGNRKFEDFISLLKKYGINMVVDVRRFPKSKYPEYVNVFMGDTLGGFRRGYEKHMETETYKEGIKNLLELTKQGKVVIMCLERSPKGCHRRYISQTLKALDVGVAHIIKENAVLVDCSS